MFVDCGANTCQLLRHFIRELPGYEFYAFEPQPELGAEGARVAAEHPDVPIHFFNYAVWTRNEDIDLYLAANWDDAFRDGSTVVAGHVDNAAEVDYTSPVRVQAIDFSAWIAETVAEQDYVIVKMDIEGAEYDVLEKLIRDGNADLIDEMIVEFHQHMNPTISRERHDELVDQLQAHTLLKMWD